MKTKVIMVCLIFVIIISTVLIIGIEVNLKKNRTDEIPNGGLKIYSWDSAIGGNDDHSITTITYNLYITNASDTSCTINAIQPELEKIDHYKVLNNLKLQVKQTILPNATVTISGEIDIDSSNLSKIDLDALGSIITSVTISSEGTIELKKGTP